MRPPAATCGRVLFLLNFPSFLFIVDSGTTIYFLFIYKATFFECIMRASREHLESIPRAQLLFLSPPTQQFADELTNSNPCAITAVTQITHFKFITCITYPSGRWGIPAVHSASSFHCFFIRLCKSPQDRHKSPNSRLIFASSPLLSFILSSCYTSPAK